MFIMFFFTHRILRFVFIIRTSSLSHPLEVTARMIFFCTPKKRPLSWSTFYSTYHTMFTYWSCNYVFISPLEVSTTSGVPIIFSTHEKRSTDILFAGTPPHVFLCSRVHPEFGVVSFDIGCRYKITQ